MNVKKPSNSDKKNIKAILKEKGIINVSMKKNEWYIVVHYHPAIIAILTSYGYSIDHEKMVVFVYIPRRMKRLMR